MAVAAVLTAPARAQEAALESYMDRATAELGSVMTLTIKVSGVQSAAPVELPPIDGLQINYIGPSTSMTIINGQYASSIAFRYDVIPMKVGTYQIPAITTTIKGKTYTAPAIDIKVVEAAAGHAGGNPAGQSLQDKIFVIMGTPRREVYPQEKVPLTVKLFINGLSVRNVQYPDFPHEGVRMDDFNQTNRYTQNIAGVMYDVLELQTFIYPQTPGEITLGPATLKCKILFDRPRGSSGSSGGLGSIFDDPLINQFFSAGEARWIPVTSADLTLKVLDLPAEGRPPDFAGAVGRFEMEATVTPEEVRVGDPVTVRVTVSGDGDLGTVDLKGYAQDAGWKVYDPQVSEKDGTKILEQVLIPTSDTLTSIPPLRFSYFNPEARQYQVLTRGPFPIKVRPAEADTEMKIVGMPAEAAVPAPAAPPEALGKDISFIKDRIGSLQPVGGNGEDLWLLMWGLTGSVLWGAWVVVYYIRHRIRTDTRLARRLRAPREARQGLRRAKDSLARGDQREFYDTLFKTLQDYFGNKFHLPAGAVNLETMTGIIRRKGMKPAALEAITAVFTECEMVRYASAAVGQDAMTASYNRAAEVIDLFERSTP